MLACLAPRPRTSSKSFQGKQSRPRRSRVARIGGSKPPTPAPPSNPPPTLPWGPLPPPPGPRAAEKREEELSDPQGCPESWRAEGVGRWAPTRGGRKGRGRAPERDATVAMRRCPGSGRGGGEPRLKRRRPLSATPRTAGERAAARPVGRRGLRARGAPGAGWCSRGRRCTPDLRVYPGADDAPGGGGCCRGAGGCSRGQSVLPQPAGTIVASQQMLPGWTSEPGVSGRSPRPALTPRRRDRRLREAPGDTAGYLKRGESFRHSSKSTVIFILPLPGLAGDAGGAAGAAGAAGAGERRHRGSGRRRRALGRL